MKIHFETGVEFTSPNRFATIEHADYEPKKPTWAERKRDELVWKLKTRKVLMNVIVITLLMIVSIIVTLAFIFGIAYLVGPNPIMGIILGVLGAQMIILAYYTWTGMFETNPTFISVKHKNKIYNLWNS